MNSLKHRSWLIAPLALLPVHCNHCTEVVTNQDSVVQDSSLLDNGAVQQRDWFYFADHASRVSCEYELEVTWVTMAPHETLEKQSGAEVLAAAMLSEGAVEPVFEDLALSMLELWNARSEDPRYAKPGKYQITRGASGVLQFSLGFPIVHSLRTPDLALTFSAPPGQLTIEKRDSVDKVHLYEPQTLLEPLPWGKDLPSAKKLSWEPIGDKLLRAKESPKVQSTVWIDASNRPLAYWFRFSKDPDVMVAGFYEWGKGDSDEDFPSRTIVLRGQGGGIFATMYRVKPLVLNDSQTEPFMILTGVNQIIDARGKVRMRVAQPLPGDVQRFVQIENE